MQSFLEVPASTKRSVMTGLSICQETIVFMRTGPEQLIGKTKVKDCYHEDRIGGTSWNTAAVCAHTFGLNAIVAGAVGNDDSLNFRQLAKQKANSYGFTLTLLPWRTKTSRATVLTQTDSQGESPLLSEKPGYNRANSGQLLRLLRDEAPAVFAATGVSDTTEASLFLQCFRQTAAAKILNPRSELIQLGAPFYDLLPLTDLLVLNLSELSAALHRTLTADQVSPELLKPLHVNGIKTIVITCNKHGVFMSSPAHGLWIEQQALVLGDVVDKTGAGDAFLGAFIAAILKKKSPPEALHWGVTCAALSSLTLGGANPPDPDKFKNIIQ